MDKKFARPKLCSRRSCWGWGRHLVCEFTTTHSRRWRLSSSDTANGIRRRWFCTQPQTPTETDCRGTCLHRDLCLFILAEPGVVHGPGRDGIICNPRRRSGINPSRRSSAASWSWDYQRWKTSCPEQKISRHCINQPLKRIHLFSQFSGAGWERQRLTNWNVLRTWEQIL